MKYSGPRLISLSSFPLILLVSAAFGQQSRPTTPTEKPVDDVVRVNTALVQTDVTVESEQFELRVDARVQPIVSNNKSWIR